MGSNSQILEIRGAHVNSFIICTDSETILIDTGFNDGVALTETALNKLDRTLEDVTHILLTHGHLDHTFNLHTFKKKSPDAIICASPKEELHIAGTYPYKGITRICGWAESLGRNVLGYTPESINMELIDSQVVDIANGLEIIALPGHTYGHLGFLHLESRILFTGDLVDFRKNYTRFSPPFLNTCPEFFPSTTKRVLKMDLDGIYSSHGQPISPKEQLSRFHEFGESYLRTGKVRAL